MSRHFQAYSDRQKWTSSKICWGESCLTYQMIHNMDTTTRTLTAGHDSGLHSPLVSVACILVLHFLHLPTFAYSWVFSLLVRFVSLNYKSMGLWIALFMLYHLNERKLLGTCWTQTLCYDSHMPLLLSTATLYWPYRQYLASVASTIVDPQLRI